MAIYSLYANAKTDEETMHVSVPADISGLFPTGFKIRQTYATRLRNSLTDSAKLPSDKAITKYIITARNLRHFGCEIFKATLNEQKSKGVGILYIGEDLDVLLELCDRIMVMCGGKVTGIVDAKTATKEMLGLMMTGSSQEEAMANV